MDHQLADSADILNITSPPPFRLEAIVLCAIVISFLVFVIQKNTNMLLAVTVQALGTWLVLLFFFFIAGAILYRNILRREHVVIVKAGAVPGDARSLVIACDDLMAIELLSPPPGAMSAEAKMASLGFGGERLLLRTREASVPFGIGLSDSAAAAAVLQMEAFCCRRLWHATGAARAASG